MCPLAFLVAEEGDSLVGSMGVKHSTLMEEGDPEIREVEGSDGEDCGRLDAVDSVDTSIGCRRSIGGIDSKLEVIVVPHYLRVADRAASHQLDPGALVVIAAPTFAVGDTWLRGAVWRRRRRRRRRGRKKNGIGIGEVDGCSRCEGQVRL